MRRSHNHKKPQKKKLNKKTLGPRETRPLKSIGHLLPEQVEAVVTFNNETRFDSNVPSFSYPYYTNAPYDVDPALGSTATVGLAEFTNFYSGMRVLRYSGSVDFISEGQNPIQIFLLHAPDNLSITAGGAAVSLQPYVGNPHMQRFVLGHSTASQGKHTFRFNKSITQVWGGPEPYTDDKFASSTTSVPSAKTYVLLGATSYVNNFATNPVRTFITLNMRVRFFQRKQLNA